MHQKAVAEIMAIERSGSGGDVGSTALADEGDTVLVDVGGAGNVGSKGDGGGAVLIRSRGSIVIPLICNTYLAQLLRQ